MDYHDPHHDASMNRPQIRTMLRQAGLRPTRQRLALAELLFAKGFRHLSAENLHEEALMKRVPVSLATIYNTLNLLVAKGLLRQVALTEGRVVFDPNTSAHHHFIDDETGVISDIPWDALEVSNVNQLEGFDVREYQVVLRGSQSKKKRRA